MKSRSDIWLSALEEFGVLCSVSTTKDAERALRRFEDEGVSFFTMTLPQYARDLEKSLACGGILPELFPGWKRKRLDIVVQYDDAGVKAKKFSHRGAPVFLQSFMDIIFDSTPEMHEEAYLRVLATEEGPCPRMRTTDDEETVVRIACAIWAVRQLSLMFSKEKELCSDSLIQAAIDQYVQLDEELVLPLPTSVWFPSSRGTTSDGW